MADHDRQPGAVDGEREPARGGGAAKRSLVRAPKPLALPGRIGNRAFTQFARTLARDVDTSTPSHSVRVRLSGPPPPISAGRRVTSENTALAKLIDEFDQLGERDLRARREAEARAASDPTGADLAQHQLALEAAEFVMRWHRIGGPLSVPALTDQHSPADERRNTLGQLEQRIAQSGSFRAAYDELAGKYDDDPHKIENDDWRAHSHRVEDLAFLKSTAATFEREFRRQAQITTKRLLAASRQEIVRLIKSYGLDVWTVLDAAHMMAAHFRELDDEVARVIKNSNAQPNEVENSPSAINMRRNLAHNAAWIREQQAVVQAAHHEVNKDTYNVPINRTTGPEWEALKRDQATLTAAQQELQTRWILAEGVNPVFAEYRRGGDVETADVSALDTHDTEAEMTEVVRQVLPTLRDIEKAEKLLLGPAPEKSPLAVPSIAAATRANMFIPAGSLQDGVANDAVNAAVESEQEGWLTRLGELVLVIVSTVATGGAALVADLALAGVGVYEAQRAWAEYSNDKTLADTNLDLARSLATQEPSLTGFAVALISAGISAIPAIGLFAKAIKLKALIKAGEDGSKIIDELNAVKKGLGDEAAAEIKESERLEQEAKEGENQSGDGGGKDHEPGEGGGGGGGRPPKGPPGSRFAEAGKLREAIDEKLKIMIKSSGSARLDEDWAEVEKLIAQGPTNLTKSELKRLAFARAAMADEKAIKETIVMIWEKAQREQITCEQAMIDLAGEGKPVETLTARPPNLTAKEDFERFREMIRRDRPFYDAGEAATDHGGLSHLFQEVHMGRVLGNQGAARALRHLIANVEGPGLMVGNPPALKGLWSYLWDAMFDGPAGAISSPETLNPVINFTLDLPGYRPRAW